MLFFKRKELAQLKEMNASLGASFQKVKEDIHHISSWIHYLHQNQEHQQQALSQRLDNIEDQVHDILKVRHEVREILNYYYQHEQAIKHIQDEHGSISGEVQKLKSRLDSVFSDEHHQLGSQIQLLSEIKEMRHKLAELETRPARQNVREKLIKNLTQRSRDYVKSLMMNYIRKYERISAMKLREMIVAEQGLASKSAFYRLLEELEQLDEIEAVREGREKFYFYKLSKVV